MKSLKKVLIMAVMAFVFAMNFETAFACTGIYVGKDVSDSGDTYFGRSEDMGGHTKRFIIHEAQTHEEGEMFEDAYGFSMPYPAESYRYSAVEDSHDYGEGDRPYGEVGINEFGVAISATVSTEYNEAAAAADPLNTESGICELSITEVVLSHVKTAEEAVEYLGSIVEEYGAGENNLIMFSDSSEVWVFEIVSGHNWAAYKMPTDKVAVMPNHILLGTIDVNSEDVKTSANLVTLAKENDFLVEEDGMINVMKTYSPTFEKYDSYRIWGGHQLLAPSSEIEAEAEYYPMFFTPDNKVSLMDIKNVLSYRYEGTENDFNNMEMNYEKRPIGVERQAEVHVFQMADQDINTQWLAMANIEFSVFVPFYTRILTDTPDMMKFESVIPTDGQYDWTFRTLSALCSQDREQYGAGVRAYWDHYQEALIEANKDVIVKINELYQTDPTKAEEKATQLAFAISQEAYDRAELITNELIRYMAKEEGYKAGYLSDPEKYADAVKPFVPSLETDGIYTEYNFDMVLDTQIDTVITNDEEKTTSTTNPMIYAVVGFALGGLITYFVTKQKKS